MADPNLTDVERDRIFSRYGFLQGLERDFVVLERFLAAAVGDGVRNVHLARKVFTGAADELDAIITDLRVSRARLRSGATGAIVDTDINGVIYGTFTDGGGGTGHTVTLFNDQPRTVTVATGPATNDNQTMVISPSAGFFFAALLDIGVTTGASFNFAFEILPPVILRVDDEFDGTEGEDAAIATRVTNILTGLRGDFVRSSNRFRAELSNLYLTYITRKLVTASGDSSLIVTDLTRQGDGTVVEAPRGRLEDMRRAGADNSAGAGPFTVQEQVETPTVSFPGAFQGTGSAVATTDRAEAGVLQFNATKNLDGTPPQFTAEFTPTDSRRKGGINFTDVLTAELVLTVGKVWKSQTLGIDSFTLDYLATITNTSGTPFNTTPALWSTTNLTSGNSDAGRLFARIDSGTLQFFSTQAARDGGDLNFLVASIPNPGAATAFTATGASGLTVSGTMGAAPVDGNQGDVNYNPPQETLPFSFFQIAMVITTEPSLFQRRIREGGVGNAPWRLNAGGAPNISDGRIIAGSLFGSKTFGDTN